MSEDSVPSNPALSASKSTESNTCCLCKQVLTGTTTISDSGAAAKEEGDQGTILGLARSDHHTPFNVKVPINQLAEIESKQRDIEQLAMELSMKIKLQGAALCALRQNGQCHTIIQQSEYEAQSTTCQSIFNQETFHSLKVQNCLMGEVEPELDSSSALILADQDSMTTPLDQHVLVVGVNPLGLPADQDHLAAVTPHL